MTRWIPMAALLLSACVSQLSPTTFQMARRPDAVSDVQRILAERGVGTARVDRTTGIVETAWEDTGRNNDGTIWAARYVIIVGPSGTGEQVTVTMDLRVCEPGLGTSVTGQLDASSCTRPPPGTTPVMYQNQLDDLAASLRARLAGT